MANYSVVCPVESENIKKILDKLKNTRNISEYYEIIPYESVGLAFMYFLNGNSEQNMKKLIVELEKAFSYISQFSANGADMYIYPNQTIGINIIFNESIIVDIFQKLRIEASRNSKIDRREVSFHITLARNKKTMTNEIYQLCKDEIIEIYKKIENPMIISFLKPSLCLTYDNIKKIYLS
jgi:hypothetical protein